MKAGEYWLTVAIESGGPWPLEDTPVKFIGRDILLMAETKGFAQRIAILCIGSNDSLDALRIVRQFLSAFAWVEECPIRELFSVGTSRPANLGKGPRGEFRSWPPIRHFSNVFYYDYLPELTDLRARLALALFREALNVDSLHYKFLSYYKVINILHKSGKPHPKRGGPAQVTWINQTVTKLQDFDAKKRLQQLQSQVTDVGNYLYESGRCAIAHAYGNPVADPDDPKDTMRLTQDLPLVEALAKYAIENEFGVKSAKKIRGEHLYELAGFHLILGKEISTQLKNKVALDAGAIPKFPPLTLRATRENDGVEFNSFLAKPFAVVDGCLALHVESSDGLVVWRLILDFVDERLRFDPYDDSVWFDDYSPKAAQYALNILRFKEVLLLNGRLEIWDTDTGKCLGKTDAYIPQNIDVRRTLQTLSALKEDFETILWMRNSPVVDACDI